MLQRCKINYVSNKQSIPLQIVIHLVSISNTNPESFKVPFKTQPIAY